MIYSVLLTHEKKQLFVEIFFSVNKKKHIKKKIYCYLRWNFIKEKRNRKF